MGINNSKQKVCANYQHFNLDNFAFNNEWYYLKLYPCRNANNLDKGVFKRGNKTIPVKVYATFEREYPRNCYIHMCKECFQEYYQGKDIPDIQNSNDISYLSDYHLVSMNRPVWNCQPEGFTDV